MTTIDMMTAGIGRWMVARTETRARRRRNQAAWVRTLQALLQIVGLGWLDYAAWTLGRTVGYVAIGITFILVSAMITGKTDSGDGGRR